MRQSSHPVMSIERARRIADPVLAELAVFAARWAEEHRLPPLIHQELNDVAAECVAVTLFELPPSIVYAVENRLIRPIVHKVGWEAMFEALCAALGSAGPPDATSDA